MDEKTAKKILEKSRENYEKLAEKFSRTRDYPWIEMASLVKYIKNGDRILDLGCGNGRFYQLIKNRRIEYIGLDNCQKLIEIARKKFAIPKFVIGDALNLPFQNKEFNIIFAVASFHHIPSIKYRLQTLKEIKRVLKNNGLLILTVWNLWQPKLLIKYKIWPIIFGWKRKGLDYRDVFIPWKLPDRKIIYRYYHAFTKSELEKLIKQSGFKIIDYYYEQKEQKTNWIKGHNLVAIVKKL